jgi:hypothetical protein
MTQEEKDLLLKDLCARLPYKVIVEIISYSDETSRPWFGELSCKDLDCFIHDVAYKSVKPYLRSISSMTEEEKEEIKPLFSKFIDEFGKRVLVVRQNKIALYQDWLNAHHFDYRGLIPKGLAIEVTKENNPYKE